MSLFALAASLVVPRDQFLCGFLTSVRNDGMKLVLDVAHCHDGKWSGAVVFKKAELITRLFTNCNEPKCFLNTGQQRLPGGHIKDFGIFPTRGNLLAATNPILFGPLAGRYAPNLLAELRR